MHGSSLHGNREISSLTAGGCTRRRPASGRRGAEADDVRTGEVTFTGSTDEVGAQNGLARGGVDGGKRWDREECGTAKHSPDSVPAKLCHRHTPAYVGPSTAARCHLLAIRTVCGNSARTDLCGGCPVMGIPTAILPFASWISVHQGRAASIQCRIASFGLCFWELRTAGVGRGRVETSNRRDNPVLW